MITKKSKKMLLIINVLFFAGLLAHSIILFTLNKNFNPLGVTKLDEAANYLRMHWRQRAEFILAIGTLVYIWGHILMSYFFIKKNVQIPLLTAFIYFIIQICLIFICTVSFGIFDVNFFYDYLFPIRSTMIELFIIFSIFSIIMICKKRDDGHLGEN